jgi:hypothetical protein
MATFIDLCNAALVRIGVPIIASFNDGTNQSNACSNRYQFCVNQVLQMHPWNCATTRAILAPSAVPPAFDYSYAFPLPADFLRELDVSSQSIASDTYMGPRDRYRIEGGNILFDTSTLYLRYIQQVTNANQLDALCQQAIGAYIAFDLAQTLLRNPELTSELDKQFKEILAEARNVNSAQLRTWEIIDHYERTRFYGPT